MADVRVLNGYINGGGTLSCPNGYVIVSGCDPQEVIGNYYARINSNPNPTQCSWGGFENCL